MSSRQLAAIMFTDMVGYTAMMQSDEEMAKLRQERQKEVCETAIRKYQGKIIQSYGDGALAVFSSTINSVHCAIDIQRALRKAPEVDLRIGIHVGDILVDETGIYGDGVNIASRIETLASPGSIFISERVYDDIQNQKDVLTRDMGFFEMKNVRHPLHIYTIANDGLNVPSRKEIKGKTKSVIQSIAVLPFVNMSGDEENEYFSDGITEELINALAGVDELHVISRTSAFAMKDRHDDIRAIAAQLNVQRVVEGSVRKSGNRVRITAQLINAGDGFHIWSETFDRDLTDIFAVQDEISQMITNRLRTKLLPEERGQSLIKAPTQNLDAYALYLKGKFYHNKETPTETLKAIDYYKKAIELEPGFALPYAMLAGCYALLGSVGAMPSDDASILVTEYAETSLKLDPELSEAHVAKATAELFFEWNWDAAYRSLMQANELNPGSTTTLWILGYYYLFVDQAKHAIELLEYACQLDPLAIAPSRTLGFAYFFAERYKDTSRLSDTQVEMAPDNWFAMTAKAFAVGMLGDWNAALELFEKARGIAQNAPMAVSYVAFCLGQLGRKEEAREHIEFLEAFQDSHPDLAKYVDLFVAYYGVGERDKAFDCVFRAVEVKEQLIAFIINSPILKDIKQDPRYKTARLKMGFS